MSDNIIVLDTISAAERRVLARVVQGESNKEIGLVLGIQEGTAKIHVASLCRKYGVNNRTKLALMALGAIGTEARP